MSTGKKTILGILSFAAVILIAVWMFYLVRWIMDFAPGAISYEANPDLVISDVSGRMNIRNLIGTTFALLLPSSLISIGLLIYYIIQIVNDPRIDIGERVAWIIMMVLFCPLVFPIYWFMRIRNFPTDGAGTQLAAPVPHGPTYS